MRSWLLSGILLAGVCLLAPPFASPTLAQMDSREYLTLRNQIDQLRYQLQQLQEQGSRGGSSLGGGGYYQQPQALQPSGDMVAQLLTRVDALDEQVRQLRGKVDELRNQVQQQNADLGKRLDDLAFQMNPQAATGGQPGTAPGSTFGQPSAPPPGGPAATNLTTRPPAQTPTPGPQRPRTPELAMQEGNTALSRHDYTAAEAAAREVLAARTSPRAYDAQLLLAQALYGQKQFPQAAIAFDDAYNRSRKGSHAQDALVGLASSLTAINEKKAACDTLNRLHAEFNPPRADLRETVASVRQRAGCR
jgi:TolA-binding protein